MGRKKIEFTKEQDECIAQMVNDGYSLNGILSIVNEKFGTNFSRSGINRRIKGLGIVRANNVGDTTILNPIIANKVEELKEWKRKQHNSRSTITEQNIADSMGICVKTLKKMYKQFDIPQKLYYQYRPDIYFNVNDVVDCTGLKKHIREELYSLILKYKPQNMRVEQDVVVHIEPMTITFRDDNYVKRTAKMKGVDLKVDFYFPDYNTAFFYDTSNYYKSVCKEGVNSSIAHRWSGHLKRINNKVKLMTFIPFKSFDDTYFNLTFSAKAMIARAISGEYNHWKYVESLH